MPFVVACVCRGGHAPRGRKGGAGSSEPSAGKGCRKVCLQANLPAPLSKRQAENELLTWEHAAEQGQQQASRSWFRLPPSRLGRTGLPEFATRLGVGCRPPLWGGSLRQTPKGAMAKIKNRRMPATGLAPRSACDNLIQTLIRALTKIKTGLCPRMPANVCGVRPRTPAKKNAKSKNGPIFLLTLRNYS